MARSEYEKMLAKERYLWTDPALIELQDQARDILQVYNALSRRKMNERSQCLAKLLGRVGSDVWIESPFYCDYGRHILLGDRVYMNFNCILIDCNFIEIGDDSFLGPSVQIYTATHPLNAIERSTPGNDIALPVHIGRHVWIGGGAIVLPGVQIGDRSTIGAGSVVTRDIPPDVMAAGNPCRVLKELKHRPE